MKRFVIDVSVVIKRIIRTRPELSTKPLHSIDQPFCENARREGSIVLFKNLRLPA